MSATVPEGLSELLEEFAVAVLREKPANLVEFAARYFSELHESRKQLLPGREEEMAAQPEPASTAEVEMDAEEGKTEFGFEVCRKEWQKSVLCLLRPRTM